jgi:hypothetical protein
MPSKWPYRAAKPGRTRRVIKVRDENEPHGVLRRDRQEPPRPWITPGQARLLVFVALVVSFITAGFYAYNSPWLTVQTVNVDGTVALSQEEVRLAADLDGDSGFGLDIAGAKQRIAALPNVRNVTVKQDSWNAVSITVEERAPWGSWEINGVKVPVDIDGYVMDDAAPAGSPVILEIDPHRVINAGDRLDPGAVTLAARLVDEADTAFGRQVLALVYRQSAGLTVVLSGADIDSQPVWVTFGDSRDYEYKVASLYVLLEQAKENDLRVRAVDLRFGDRLSFN